MPTIIFSLIFVFLTVFLIEPTACALSTDLQNLEVNGITSLRHEFPSTINKIQAIINQFHCPKDWKHFGGSCYYLPKIRSISIQANHTCNLLYSHQSNLMQIRHTVELVYAAYVLTKNNLSELMIEIDSSLWKGEKDVTGILTDDQGEWQRMKDKFRELRVKYYKLKKEIVNELNTAGLRISKRWEKIVPDHSDFPNVAVDEYEYDNFDSEDENDDIQGICDQINWNVINTNSTVYMLTISSVSDKMICSLSNVEPDIKYQHVCQYVLNFCFANNKCGKHGRCVNTASGFKCSCSFLYDGLLCERISNQGKQIIGGLILIFVLYGLSIIPIQWIVRVAVKGCRKLHNRRKIRQQSNRDRNDENTQEQCSMDQYRPIAPLQRREFIFQKEPDSIKNPNKHSLIRFVWVGGLSLFFLTLLLSLTTMMQLKLSQYDVVNQTKLDSLVRDIAQVMKGCERISIYSMNLIVFFPIALALIFIFSFIIKRDKKCLNLCNGRPGLLPPIEPFRIENRLPTATVFGILAFEVLQIFEQYFFREMHLLNQGILLELLQIMALVLVTGLRHYPVLASLQLRNIAARFLVCVYILTDIVYTIIREGSCMSVLSLSGYYSTSEEAKLRREFSAWYFIIYGLIKNIPYFILLSYITAELFVRFAYDSIYVSIKKKRSIWSAPIAESDESALAKYYVTKLFRRKLRFNRTIDSTNTDIGNLEDFEHAGHLQRKSCQSRFKRFLDSIYHSNDDFHFTTIFTCTYTVAVVFLYYLAYTLVFPYISLMRYYIETTFNIEFQGYFSLRSIVIISAVSTIGIIALQLYIGVLNYRKHKLQLFKGIYQDIPSALNFKSNTIVSNSFRYFGFLVGHMTCGFIILFHLIIFILCTTRVICLQIPYIELLLAIIVPILVLYLLTMVGTSSVGKCIIINHMRATLSLRNRKVYAIFVYFNFFSDCFLGFVACIIRLIKVTFLNLIYISRLDCSLHGRPLEKLDLGFATYVSYLHMEVIHTNPVMLAFCYSLYEDIVQRRPKHDYDDDCCTASGELDNDEREPANADRKNSINTDDENDDDTDLSKEETKYPNSSAILKKGSQKFKQQIANNTQEQVHDTPIRAKLTPFDSIAALLPTTASYEAIKKKQARFRWFLAYTIINNYHLLDIRKHVQNRLALLHFVRSNSINEAHASALQLSDVESESSESPVIRQREKKVRTHASKISKSSAVTHGQLFMPDSDVDDDLQQVSYTSPLQSNSTEV